MGIAVTLTKIMLSISKFYLWSHLYKSREEYHSIHYKHFENKRLKNFKPKNVKNYYNIKQYETSLPLYI